MTSQKEQDIPDLLTFRQFLFLSWLYQRKVQGDFCDLENIDIECYNCLKRNKICKEGVIPASYFYKKTSRQYYDSKRVLDSLEEEDLIIERDLSEAKDFHIFFEISEKGIEFYHKFIDYYWLNFNEDGCNG